ncbi:Tetratricopeptide TPR_2 repeat protein [Chthoniobacter flavus Ellin428]|uniref:Tetratricopeptide TPR_2 repeat protein n=1 Tax=Chthoniobacter flavus Ellin428 TaxID=497964 RepID=B4D9S8_9BACT|nr:Tetratricopeptide TPR_2 repeat protein [Chthoniobacter flavus Ellin428]TCO93318.1 tetratricopeptide repeat protein [Chthoniobacter flavus]
MKSIRSIWALQRYRTFFTANLALLLALPLFAEPAGKSLVARKNAKTSSTAPSGTVPSTSGYDPHDFADAFPSAPHPVAPDLLLKKDDERKAEALAAFSQGLLAEDNADQEKMIDAYKKTLALDPTYAELAVKLAYELSRRNDPTGGVQILKDTIKAAPKEAVPYIYLSQLYAKDLNKPDIGLKYAEQALALAPDNFAAYLAVYEIDMATGQSKKAEQLLDRAAKSEHGDAKYWVQLGDLCTRLYLKEDGSSEPAQLQKMNAIYRKAANLAKEDATTLTKVGDYFVLSKQTKDAIPYYRQILDNPQNAGDVPLNNVRDKLARCYLVVGQRNDAVKYLEDIIKDSPLRFETYELLGELYEANDDLEKALANYEHSLLLDASEPRNHLRLAELLMRAKRYDRAVEIMQAARKKFPDMPSITLSLALALSQAKRHPEAMAAFSDAQAEAEVSREEMLNAQFYLLYGEAAEQAGLIEKAAELIKQSLEMEPNSAEACNYLGYMWVDRGEHLDEAGDLIKKALSLDPDKGEYLDSLGWYYFKKGEPERALTELLRAQESILRETKKDDATVLEHIGDTYSKLGKTAEALNYWQKSLTLEENKKVSEKIENAKQKVTSGTPPLPAPPKP